jgi:hypothetical protein
MHCLWKLECRTVTIFHDVIHHITSMPTLEVLQLPCTTRDIGHCLFVASPQPWILGLLAIPTELHIIFPPSAYVPIASGF